MAKDPRLYIEHMMGAIANIEDDTAGVTIKVFREDRRIFQLVERNLEIISEASRRLPDHLKDTEADIKWPAIAGIGNILRHEYHKASPEIIWRTCEAEIPPLKEALVRLMKRLDDDTGS